MKLALVLGDQGFIGRHCADRLEQDGWDVIGWDVKSGGDVRAILPDIHIRFDAVFHCAAVVGGRAKIDGAPLEVAYDFGLDSDVIQFCARTKPGRVVLFSSSAAYPVFRQRKYRNQDQRRAPLAEDEIELGHMDGSPDAVYGWCKLALEVQARELAKLGTPVHLFRPFSGYGSDQDDDYPWPAIMKRALAKPDPFELWSPLDQTRDWIHVDDVVSQVMACIAADERGPVNLCTGVPTTFGNLAHLACEAVGYYPYLMQKEGMPSGVHYRVGDPTRINKVCPAKISVAEGVARSLEELA